MPAVPLALLFVYIHFQLQPVHVFSAVPLHHLPEQISTRLLHL
ncbi:hypothetical protein [Megamonas hypermegale]